MTRGTTPTVSLTLDDMTLNNLRSVYITFRQGSMVLTKRSGEDGVEISEHTAEVFLTQEETLKFHPGLMELQLLGLTHGGEAFASDIARLTVSDVLLNEVIT